MSKYPWLVIAAMVTLLVPVAIAVTLAGWIPRDFRISLSHVAIAGVGVLILGHLLFHPQGGDDSAREEDRRRQTTQARLLEDISQMLPHLLPEAQRAHLLHLESEKTDGYQGTAILRGELRRLCAMGLVRTRIGRRVRQIADGTTVDLGEYVELTPLGAEWVKSILAIEKAEKVQRERAKDRDQEGHRSPGNG